MIRDSRLLLLLLASAAVVPGCAANDGRGSATGVSEDNVESVPEASGDALGPLDRPLPSGNGIRSCEAAATSEKPLRVFHLYPTARSIDLGQGIMFGGFQGVFAKGDVQRDADNIAGAAYGALVDHQDVASWMGAGESGFGQSQSNLEPLPNSSDDPLRAWGVAQRATMLRMTYAIAWYQMEHDFYLEGATRTAETPTSGAAEYVSAFGGRRYFGAVFGVDIASDCAMGALADAIGARPTVLTTAVGKDPRAQTIFDPQRRASIQRLLVRDGAQLYVSVVSNRPRADVDALLAMTTCSAADLDACEKLVDDLGAASKAIAATVPASRYEQLARNESEWTVTKFEKRGTSHLR